MNLVNGVYLLNEVIGVNGVILMYGDDWDEFGECGVYLVNEMIGVNGVIRMYGVNWESGMHIANVGCVANEGEYDKWD